LFSSWFDHAIKATSVARIWQVQEYDDASSLLLLVSTSGSALLRQPESQ